MSDRDLATASLQRICNDLSMITDRELRFDEESVEVERTSERPVGKGQIHISFKLGVQLGDELRHGCMLMPLPDAISLACYMMMVADETVEERRALTDLDSGLKEAMLEVSNFIGGATDAALRGLGIDSVRVRSEGCQGVRADVRPALVTGEGDELIRVRARVTLHTYPEFEAYLLLPVFSGGEAGEAGLGA